MDIVGNKQAESKDNHFYVLIAKFIHTTTFILM
jgi:hypothetical protein